MAVLLAVAAALSAWAVVVGLRIRALTDDLSDVSVEELERADKLYVLTGAGQVAATVVTGVVFIVWFFWAHRNAELFEPGSQRLSAGWTIAGWIVPVVNFWWPKKIANDIWDAGTGSSGGLLSPPAARPVVTTWWTLWLLAAVGSRISPEVYAAAEELDSIRQAVAGLILTDSLTVAAALAAIVFVRRVSAMQQDRHMLAAATPETSSQR